MRIGLEPGDGNATAGTRPIVLDHYVAEVGGIPAGPLGDPLWVSDLADDLAERLTLHVVERHLREFSPGVTCLWVLAQSHLALHTWPEHCYLHLDLVACSELHSVERALPDALGAMGCAGASHSLRRVEYVATKETR